MTSKQKIIKFMHAKQKVVDSLSTCRTPYMTRYDYRAINLWTDKNCDRVWKFIISSINRGTTGLQRSTCPFCLLRRYNRGCINCEYGANNYECSHPRSRYVKITKRIKLIDLTEIVYRDLLKQVAPEDCDGDS